MFDWFLKSDPNLVLLSVLYIVAVVVVSEGLRKALSFPSDVSRKMVHVLVAVWALPTALLFESPWWAALGPAIFVGVNALSYKYRWLDTMEEDGEGSPGTIYFPLIFAVLILVFWNLGSRAAMVAGIYAMGFGDAAASVIGRRWGKHTYHLLGVRKSYEGSLAMFVFAFVGILLGTYPLQWTFQVVPALGAALTSTLAEAPVGEGKDNLTAPAVAAIVFFFLQG